MIQMKNFLCKRFPQFFQFKVIMGFRKDIRRLFSLSWNHYLNLILYGKARLLREIRDVTNDKLEYSHSHRKAFDNRALTHKNSQQ
mgnify:CR=1 FL=1